MGSSSYILRRQEPEDSGHLPSITSTSLMVDSAEQFSYRFDEPCERIRDSHDHRSDFFSPLFFVRV